MQNGTLLIGTSTCEIVTVDITAPDTAPTVLHRCRLPPYPPPSTCRTPPQVHLHAHSGAVMGLCVSPLENCAVTVSRPAAACAAAVTCHSLHQVGEDRTLRFWDLEQRRMEAAFNLGMRCRSVHVSPDGRLYAVGHAAGQFSLWDVASMRCAAKNAFRKEEVDDIRFRCVAANASACSRNAATQACNKHAGSDAQGAVPTGSWWRWPRTTTPSTSTSCSRAWRE